MSSYFIIPTERGQTARRESCHVRDSPQTIRGPACWLEEPSDELTGNMHLRPEDMYDEYEDSGDCEGCRVFGALHTRTRPDWKDEEYDSDSSGGSGDTITQQSYLYRLTASQEDLIISQMAEEDDEVESAEPQQMLVEHEATPATSATAMTSQPAPVENHYTVFVRLPFNRGGFVDPPAVNWSAAKEQALWDILYRQSINQADFKALAEQFEVTQAFLLAKAAWLYQRQLDQVRAQMRNLGTRNSATPSPTPGSVSGSVVDGQVMRRAGSGGSRVPSRLSTQHVGSPVTGGGDSTPGTPIKSRTSLPLRTAPAAAGGGVAPSTRAASGNSRPLSRQSSRDVDAPVPAPQSRRGSIQHQLARSPGQARTTQAESSSSEDEMTQSRITNRRQNPSSLHRRALSYRTDTQPLRGPAARPEDNASAQPRAQDNDEDEDDEPSFLPFANPATESRPRPSSGSQQDPSATLRGALQTGRPVIHRRTTSERIVSSPTVEPPTPIRAQRASQDLTSSASSLSSPTGTNTTQPRSASTADAQPLPTRMQQQSTVPRLGTPLSPSQRAMRRSSQPSAAASPRRGPGSDSASPSMGSSFSDLDDASVTQSALEEALLSGMGNTTITNVGGFGGRVTSGIGQALRSRYFDARGEGQGQGRGGNGGQGGSQ